MQRSGKHNKTAEKTDKHFLKSSDQDQQQQWQVTLEGRALDVVR